MKYAYAVGMFTILGLALLLDIYRGVEIKEAMAFWPMLIAAGVGALSGAAQNKAKREAESNAMQANAEAMRYSPWTKMNPQMMAGGANSQFADVAQGGIGGAMFGSQFGGSGGMGSTQGAPSGIEGGMTGSQWDSLQKKNLYQPNNYTMNRNYLTGGY